MDWRLFEYTIVLAVVCAFVIYRADKLGTLLTVGRTLEPELEGKTEDLDYAATTPMIV